MTKQSLAKLALSSQEETFIYYNDEGDLVIKQRTDDGRVEVVIIGATNAVQFAESLMEMVLMQVEG